MSKQHRSFAQAKAIRRGPQELAERPADQPPLQPNDAPPQPMGDPPPPQPGDPKPSSDQQIHDPPPQSPPEKPGPIVFDEEKTAR